MRIPSLRDKTGRRATFRMSRGVRANTVVSPRTERRLSSSMSPTSAFIARRSARYFAERQLPYRSRYFWTPPRKERAATYPYERKKRCHGQRAYRSLMREGVLPSSSLPPDTVVPSIYYGAARSNVYRARNSRRYRRKLENTVTRVRRSSRSHAGIASGAILLTVSIQGRAARHP